MYYIYQIAHYLDDSYTSRVRLTVELRPVKVVSMYSSKYDLRLPSSKDYLLSQLEPGSFTIDACIPHFPIETITL